MQEKILNQLLNVAFLFNVVLSFLFSAWNLESCSNCFIYSNLVQNNSLDLCVRQGLWKRSSVEYRYTYMYRKPAAGYVQDSLTGINLLKSFLHNINIFDHKKLFRPRKIIHSSRMFLQRYQDMHFTPHLRIIWHLRSKGDTLSESWDAFDVFLWR